jgi:hypothetical protein
VYGLKDEAEVTHRSAGEIQGVSGVQRRPSERDNPRHTGMVKGRPITSRLSVGLPKREIRRPIGSGRLETEWESMPTGFPLIFVSLHKRWPDQEPI